jgi:hypothetical protein
MTAPRTVEECKKMLVKIAIKHEVAPKIISQRLLSSNDKDDMLAGLITFDTLDCFVKVWKEFGMANYTDGTGSLYEHFRLYQYKG